MSVLVRRLPPLKPRWMDAIPIVCILLIAGLLMWFLAGQATSSAGATVNIWQDGTLIESHPLYPESPITITISDAYTNVIVIDNGTVSFTQSDCPGEDCVHSGSISHSGQTLVCLPNRVSVTITAADTQDGPDVIIG